MKHSIDQAIEAVFTELDARLAAVGIERLVYRPDEVAQALSVSRSKVYELIASGALPSLRIGGGDGKGGAVRIPVSALRAWVVAQTTPAPQPAPVPAKRSA